MLMQLCHTGARLPDDGGGIERLARPEAIP
jgi:hypothetical protein